MNELRKFYFVEFDMSVEMKHEEKNWDHEKRRKFQS
jgi:hypothetical protein